MPPRHLDYTQYIQSKFFMTGINTFLDIQMIDIAPNPSRTSESGDDWYSEGMLVSWEFDFCDLGSSHTLGRDPLLVRLDSDSNKIWVGTTLCMDDSQAEEAVFGGHFTNYIKELYFAEGIAAMG